MDLDELLLSIIVGGITVSFFIRIVSVAVESESGERIDMGCMFDEAIEASEIRFIFSIQAWLDK